MSLVSKYADKHARKYSPNLRNNSDDRAPKHNKTYVEYLESQLEKNLYLNEQKVQGFEKNLYDHEAKIDNIIKVIRLLQAFAETQEKENNTIKAMIGGKSGLQFMGQSVAISQVDPYGTRAQSMPVQNFNPPVQVSFGLQQPPQPQPQPVQIPQSPMSTGPQYINTHTNTIAQAQHSQFSQAIPQTNPAFTQTYLAQSHQNVQVPSKGQRSQESSYERSQILVQDPNALEDEILGLKVITQETNKAIDQFSRCIQELQHQFSLLEKAQLDFEHRVEENVQKLFLDMGSDQRSHASQNFLSPKVDLEKIVNRKIEVIMNELSQTVMKQDLVDIEARLRAMENSSMIVPPKQNTPANYQLEQKQVESYPRQYSSPNETDDASYRIKRDLDDFRALLNQCMMEQSNLRHQIKSQENLVGKDELTELDRKFSRKLSDAIQKLGNLVDKNLPERVVKKKEIMVPFFIDDRKSVHQTENQPPNEQQTQPNHSVDRMPSKLDQDKKKKKLRSSSKKRDKSKKSQKGSSMSQSRSRGPSPMASKSNLKAQKKSKEEKIKQTTRQIRQMSPRQYDAGSTMKIEKKDKQQKRQRKKSPS